jgi:deoxyribodipyrimidine photolyase-related protein
MQKGGPMPSSKSLFVILGNQLFPLKYINDRKDDLFFMAENRELCTVHTFHKHKLTFYLSAMRHYAKDLRHHDFNLIYFELDEMKGFTFDRVLARVMAESELYKISVFEIEDKAFEKWLRDFCTKNNYQLEIVQSPAFILSRQDFKDHLDRHSKPTFKAFYEEQRKQQEVLMEPNGEPSGGRFIVNVEEGLKWTHKNGTPKIPFYTHDEIDMNVIQLVDKEFPEYPGEAQSFWHPTSRETAIEAFRDFCKYRLAEFGSYEQALCRKEDFLFHSVLSALMNSGLLLPTEAIRGVLKYAAENPVPLHSLERYIRQILGWREYVHGIYQNFSEQQEEGNFWKHYRIMNKTWREGTTGVPPLDDAIKKAQRLAYNHHTERLIVLANMMNLSELHPNEAYRWFAEMHIDSVEWATAPNVYGLGLHSDGGLMTDQLYICSSNYWAKISDYKKEAWANEVDGLYWRFIDKHKEFFLQNSRLYVMTRNLDKMAGERREILWKAADAFLARNTVYP